ncbi:MAG TPA: cobalamin-independent methionine synthase II family protein [Burkholderiales bacterium]|nr:cobalamin-independent methionine synthase II family protein [Burkholderiales bacterium]
MLRSTQKILTTHVGSLPAGPSTEWVVSKQREIGLDLINEGEYTKGGDWLSYMEQRFGGFEPRPPAPGTIPLIAQGKDREAFADFYKYASEKGTLFYAPGEQIKRVRPIWVCTGPVTYTGGASLAKEIEELKRHVPVENAFLTSTAPASLEVYRRNEFYKTEEEFVFAIAEAMRVEFETIVKSGVVLQIDDAWLVALWDRIGIPMGMAAFRKRSAMRIEALNHALRNVPEDRVRYHLCWGSWHGPHAFDIELKDVVDLMLKVKAQAYLIEGANARHEHEYTVWDSVRLPAGKILIPGVVTHSTDVVEHPEVVAQRIQRFAERVGKENVIAGCDCGFGGRSHPQIAWAKLESLVKGAALV